MSDRPRVEVDPGVHFGLPHVRGVPVEAVAGHVIAGDPVDFVAADYGLDRVHVLLACWYLGTHGSPTWRRRWRVWARGAHEVLRQNHPDYSAIPDPPDFTLKRKETSP